MTRRLLRLHTSAPGKIVDYDEAKQTATVQLVVEEEAGDEKFETIPALTDVPIAWPAGGGYAITMPMAAGDLVEVIFSECDDSQWRATGDIGPPNNLRRHGLYPRAIPCGGLDSKTLPSQSGKLVISSQDGSGPAVIIDGTAVHLGGTSGEDFVALSTKVDTALTQLKSAISAAATTEAGASGLGGTTALFGNLSAWPAGSVAATLVKAK